METCNPLSRIWKHVSHWKYEKSDDIIDTDKILNFFDANRIRVYFKGKYLYEFDMTYEQFNAFREILANYDYI